MSDPLVIQGVSRSYRSGDADLHVLQGADLVLRAGEIVALVAPSGTGKSTLLHLAGLLERPDTGAVLVDGRDAGQLPDAERTAIRRDRIGFVYQAHHLLAEFTAAENVVLPQMVAGRAKPAARERALDTALVAAAIGAHAVAVLSRPDADIAAHARHVLLVPDVTPALAPLLSSVPLHLFAYHFAKARFALAGC